MKYFYLTLMGVILFFYLLSQYHYKIQLMFNSTILKEITPENFGLVNEKEYYKNVNIGVHIMKRKSVVICGMLRNSSNVIPSLIERVNKLSKLFKRYKVIIVENDSTDNTRKLLLQWAKKDKNVLILGCGVNSKQCTMKMPETINHNIDEKRIKKMAILRNIYLDYVKQHFSNYDYMVVWDMDVIGSIYLDGIANTFGLLERDKNIDMMCANGMYRVGYLNLYYDTYAHRDLNEDFDLSNKVIFDIKKRLFDINYERGEPPVKVESCFSGFGIYRISSILPYHIRYGTKITTDHIECEHVIFHSYIKNKYLNPSMIYLIILNE